MPAGELGYHSRPGWDRLSPLSLTGQMPDSYHRSAFSMCCFMCPFPQPNFTLCPPSQTFPLPPGVGQRCTNSSIFPASSQHISPSSCP